MINRVIFVYVDSLKIPFFLQFDRREDKVMVDTSQYQRLITEEMGISVVHPSFGSTQALPYMPYHICHIYAIYAIMPYTIYGGALSLPGDDNIVIEILLEGWNYYNRKF